MDRERTGHLTSYAEAKKMKSLTLICPGPLTNKLFVMFTSPISRIANKS